MRALLGAAARVAALIALVGAQVALAPASSADDSVKVPRNGKVTITGHGYGHGHGMSQYGAQGAARKGVGYRKIVKFYYPGTKWDRIHPNVRVLITGDTSKSVIVLARKGLSVRDTGDGATFALPNVARSNRWRLMPVKAAPRYTKIQYRRNGAWHRWNPPRRPKVDGKAVFKGDAEFVRGGPKTLVLPGGDKTTYRGKIRSASPTKNSGRRDTVNVVTLELYIRGVIATEMPASWNKAALKAQAVAARTYAAHQRRSHRSRYYQICDTTACQVYGGRSAETSATNKAVRDTRNRILTYSGRPAFTQFSSSSGGWTADGGYRYLPAKRDRWDGWSGNPVHTWKTKLKTSRIERAYPRLGNLRRVRVLERNGHGSWNGRVERLRLNGSKHNVTISGNTMRSVFGLRSDWFTFG